MMNIFITEMNSETLKDLLMILLLHEEKQDLFMQKKHLFQTKQLKENLMQPVAELVLMKDLN
jgi:hypothetical protein